MTIKDFIKEVETVVKLYSLRAEILARTKNAVKVKVPITENIYIQLYYNQETGTKNHVLIGWNRRLLVGIVSVVCGISILLKIQKITISVKMEKEKFQFQTSLRKYLNY